MSQQDPQDLSQLLCQAQAGDRKALTELLERFQRSIYYTALKLVHNSDDAQDMTQEVFLKIIEHLDGVTDPAAFPAWVRTVTVNTCLSFLRKDKRLYLFQNDEEADRILGELTEEDTDSLPGDYMDMLAKREIIVRMIDQLPEKQRLVVYLRYYNDLSIEEIATLMELSPGTVKSRLATARATIKAQVEGEERRGNKLYVFFPFLGRLLQEDSQAIALPSLPLTKDAIAKQVARRSAGAKAAAGKGAAAAASGKAGIGLGAKVVAGILAVSLLGGAAVGLPKLLSGQETPTQPTPPAVTQTLPDPTTTPEPTAEPTPEPTAAPGDFDPEAMLGQNISALIELFGEPMEQSDTDCRWQSEDGLTYDFFAELFRDGETIRGLYIIRGPAILGLTYGDSADAAQAALATLGTHVDVIDAGNNQTIYAATDADLTRIYQANCMDGSLAIVSVNLNQVS